MSENQNSSPRRQWPLRGVILWGVCFLFGSYVFLMLTDFAYLEMLFVLPVGWIYFITRTLPEIRLNSDLLGMAMLCVAVGGLVLHQFLRWITRYMAQKRGSDFVWPAKWTTCLVVFLGLVFMLGTAVSGIKQQVDWIRSSDVPMRVLRSPSLGTAMKLLALHILGEKYDESWDFEELQKQFRSTEDYYIYPGYRPAIKHLNGLAVFEDEKCVGILFFPRDELLRKKFGGQYVTLKESGGVNEGQIKELMLKYRVKMRSL